MSWVRERLRSFGQRPIADCESGTLTYDDFVGHIGRWDQALDRWQVVAGDRVALVTDHHIASIALLQALIDRGCVVIPLSEDDRALFAERLSTACANKILVVASEGEIAPETTVCQEIACGEHHTHPLLQPLVDAGRPGFIIFTSGSTGKGKAVLLDYERMTARFRGAPKNALRTLLFLKLDHIGGLNTLLSVIFNGGTIVTCASRQAEDICRCIERHAVELLPTTPSFLTMLLMSGMYRQHDLSSLKIITYGTEVMPGSTLATLHRLFPTVILKQTYGLSELGILSTQSKDSSSKWMKIGGSGYEIKVQNGTLWIRSDRAMLGYLNAPSPFDADGWYDTGDRVEVDGEYFKILGRESEIINVAGEKVFPAEVESFLLTLDNVKDVVVRSKPSPVIGQVVWAEFLLEDNEHAVLFKKRVVEQCRQHLAPFKVPGYITIAQSETLVGSRFKKIRKGMPASPQNQGAYVVPMTGAADRQHHDAATLPA